MQLISFGFNEPILVARHGHFLHPLNFASGEMLNKIFQPINIKCVPNDSVCSMTRMIRRQWIMPYWSLPLKWAISLTPLDTLTYKYYELTHSVILKQYLKYDVNLLNSVVDIKQNYWVIKYRSQ